MEICNISLSPENGLIGLIADTHDQIERTNRALTLFKERNISTVLHAGDVTMPSILDSFFGFDLFIALGNTDNKKILTEKCHKLGFHPPEDYYCIRCSDFKIFLLHGYTEQVPTFRQICGDLDYAMIVKGHTHFIENYTRGHIQVINPGALYNADKYSIAILDISTKNVEFLSVL